MTLKEYNLELAIRIGAPLTTEAILFWAVNNHRIQKLLVTVVLERPGDFCANLVNSVYTVIHEEIMLKVMTGLYCNLKITAMM